MYKRQGLLTRLLKVQILVLTLVSLIIQLGILTPRITLVSQITQLETQILVSTLALLIIQVEILILRIILASQISQVEIRTLARL